MRDGNRVAFPAKGVPLMPAEEEVERRLHISKVSSASEQQDQVGAIESTHAGVASSEVSICSLMASVPNLEVDVLGIHTHPRIA